jgi:hypothetical protein
MKKGLLVLGLLVVALAVPVAASANGPWYGDPDPFQCAEFDDCFWTTLVCQEGVTYEVGVYFDPAEASAEQIAEATEVYLTPNGFTWGACPVADVHNNQYWLVDIYNPVPDIWLDYCFAIMPQGYVPTDDWRGQPNHCGWTGGEVVYKGWVWLDAAGDPHYGGPGWQASYYNPDYKDLYHNLEDWNQAYLDSVQ